MTAAALSLLAGAAIVVQNALMTAMAARGLGLTGALLCNSVVGVTLLIVVVLAQGGPAVALTALARAEVWFLAPGILGTLFVFASLHGYRHQGATATIVLLVAGQLATGLALDAAGVTGGGRSLTPDRLLGVVLLLAGVFLVVRSRDLA